MGWGSVLRGEEVGQEDGGRLRDPVCPACRAGCGSLSPGASAWHMLGTERTSRRSLPGPLGPQQLRGSLGSEQHSDFSEHQGPGTAARQPARGQLSMPAVPRHCRPLWRLSRDVAEAARPTKGHCSHSGAELRGLQCINFPFKSGRSGRTRNEFFLRGPRAPRSGGRLRKSR